MEANVLTQFSLFICLVFLCPLLCPRKYAYLFSIIFPNVVCFNLYYVCVLHPFCWIWGVGLLRNLSQSVVSLPRFINKNWNPVRSGFRYVLRFYRLFTTTTIVQRLANSLGVFPVFCTGLGQAPSSHLHRLGVQLYVYLDASPMTSEIQFCTFSAFCLRYEIYYFCHGTFIVSCFVFLFVVPLFFIRAVSHLLSF